MELMQTEYDRYIRFSHAELTREESAEMIVPDSQPDLYGVLMTFAVCQIKQRAVRENTLMLEGVIETESICLAEDETRQTVRGSIPFSREYPLEGCREDTIAETQLSVVRAETQLKNPRKLAVNVQLSLRAQLYGKAPLTVSEGVRGEEDEGLESLNRPVELELLCGVAEKKLSASDEVRINTAGKLLRYEVEWKQEELRVLSGKLMVRGSACVHAILLREEETCTAEAEIPFSQVLECEGCQPGDRAELTYQTMQSQITMPEETLLSCNLTGTVWAKVSHKKTFSVLQDAYSLHYETECEKQPLHCPCCREWQQTTEICESFQPEDPPERVLDARWQARCGAEDGRMWAVYTFRVLFRTQTGKLRCGDVTVKAAPEEAVAGKELCVRAGVRDCRMTVEDDGRITLRFVAILTGQGLEQQPCSQMSACRLLREKPRQRPVPGTLVLRKAEEQETVWSVAAHYGTRAGEIRSANHLEEEALQPGQLIMIPFSR